MFEAMSAEELLDVVRGTLLAAKTEGKYVDEGELGPGEE